MFLLPAETAHHLSMKLFSTMMSRGMLASAMRRMCDVPDRRLRMQVAGLDFTNPLGLAAGFDKDARWHNALSTLGFSHIEVGTVTGRAQPGNPRPRLFRLRRDRAILNRMGFNNEGSESVASRLQQQASIPRQHVLGINIGKTKIVPNEEAVQDYLISLERLFDFADYFTINVSSPNTPGLRELQGRDALLELIPTLERRNRELAGQKNERRRPLFLKIAPDVSLEQLEDIAEIVKTTGLDGVIATNTTISRDGLRTRRRRTEKLGNGGVSGAPLTGRSRQTVRRLFRRLGPDIPIIGVGGIMSGADAWEMIGAGASLVQVYTGFIYGGPFFPRDVLHYLSRRLDETGETQLSAVVGRNVD